MLSRVVGSKRATTVNIEIMRAFVKLRQMLASNAELFRRLDELESKYDKQFRVGLLTLNRTVKEIPWISMFQFAAEEAEI